MAAIGGPNVPRQIPTIRCNLSVSFLEEIAAQNFAANFYLLTGRDLRLFKPKASEKWIVDAAVVDDEYWNIDEALSKLFSLIDENKNQIRKLIIQHRGEVVIDIATYETDTYPALFFSRETVENICFFSASIGIDLV